MNRENISFKNQAILFQISFIWTILQFCSVMNYKVSSTRKSFLTGSLSWMDNFEKIAYETVSSPQWISPLAGNGDVKSKYCRDENARFLSEDPT